MTLNGISCGFGMGFGFALQLLVLVLLLTCGACAMADLRGDAGPRWRQLLVYSVDDDYMDNPEIWLRRAKYFGYVPENRGFLRRAFFTREV